MSAQRRTDAPVYTCPMHKDVRQTGPGKCPTCGMALLPEGSRFAIIRHIMSSPMHVAFMGTVMVGLMAAVMVVWK